MPASDFLESAASGFAAPLPRFLVKQLKCPKVVPAQIQRNGRFAKILPGTVTLNETREG